MRGIVGWFFLLMLICSDAWAGNDFETDLHKTGEGADLSMTFFGHGSLGFTYQGKHIYVDPVSKYADYSNLAKADLILITHEHFDHLDSDAVGHLRKEGTTIILSESCLAKVPDGRVLRNGEETRAQGIGIKAVPAYNLKHKQPNGMPFHIKGIGNGYVLNFGDLSVYLAGDTENIPEMKNLENIDIAFLPMNLPYTMTPEMAADAARSFSPSILYPYHYGETDPQELVALLKGESGIEVRIRRLR